jgi:hypothetical protein
MFTSARLRPPPVKIRPDVSVALAAGRAGETVLDIRQPNVIRPAIAADRDGVAAAVVGAMDEQPTHALSRISAKVTTFCGRSGIRYALITHDGRAALPTTEERRSH